MVTAVIATHYIFRRVSLPQTLFTAMTVHTDPVH